VLDYPLLDFMPVQGSTWAGDVDWMNNWITNVSVLCTVAITAVMIYFAVKYRASKAPKPTSKVSHNATLETVWTVVPSIVVIYVFYIGFAVYEDMRTPPANSMEVSVTGYKWAWSFKYENGKQTTNELVVPIGEPVKLVMKSKDVIHSFFIPSMRVKEDVRADRYSFLWFEPTKLSKDEPGGVFPIFCAEYCGRDHSGMTATLKVVSKEEYNNFLYGEDINDLPPAEVGKKVYGKNCVACHSVDGSAVVGPTFKNLYGKNREFNEADAVVADENYIRESIIHSKAKIVKGYQNLMPNYEGILQDAEIDGLVAYIKTLSENAPATTTEAKATEAEAPASEKTQSDKATSVKEESPESPAKTE